MFNLKKKNSLEEAKRRTEELTTQNIRAAPTARPGIKLEKRFQLALKAAGHDDFAKRILACSTKSSCGSTFCKKCRSNLAKRLLARTERHLLRQLGGDDKQVHAGVRHVSGLFSIDQIDRSQIAYSILQARKIFEKARRGRPWFTVEGAFELELLDFRHMDQMTDQKSSVKRDQLKALLDGTLVRPLLGDDEMVVLVHWHALMVGWGDKADPRRMAKSQVKNSALDILEAEYANHHRQLYTQRLHAVHFRSTTDSLSKISSYPFKNAHRLKYTFEGAAYQNGEYIDDKTLGQFIKVYRDVGGVGNRGLRISIGG